MPRRRVVLVLVDVDRARWQALADSRGVSLERLVRDLVDAEIEAVSADRELLQWVRRVGNTGTG